MSRLKQAIERDVESGLYDGAVTIAAIGDGTVFRVQKQQHELDALDFTTGRKLFASWRPEHTYILPRS
jgi:hypothetical protein|tara:strand:- start:2062 stop:2265 length:204 start_codon:yes stop_codon:yes gene_type:complete